MKDRSLSSGLDDGGPIAVEQQRVESPVLQQPQELYERARVPLRHRRASTVATNGTEHVEWMKVRDQVCGRLGSGFLLALVGPRGPGKTQIGEQLVLAASAIERTSLYTRALTFFMEIKATYNADNLSELGVIKRYRQPHLLVIDEMQDRSDTRWENLVLSHVIDLRYGDMMDTLLLANLEPQALQDSLGLSICERLRETGGIIECNWPSFRKGLPDE